MEERVQLIEMRRRIAAFLIAILNVFFLPGCSDNVTRIDLSENNRPPVACFDIYATKFATCPFVLEFVLDPSCTTDDKTKLEDLEIRWDYDNDGNWDTSLGPLTTIDYWRPDPVLEPVWVVRCIVYDGAGKSATHTDSLAWTPIPQFPDLAAGSLSVTLSGTNTAADTILVGQQVDIMIFESCWGDFSITNYRTDFYKDSELLFQSDRTCAGEWHECHGFGKAWIVFNEPGDYLISATLDARDDYLEADETNNNATTPLTVLSR
jgi:hypothetical protein